MRPPEVCTAGVTAAEAGQTHSMGTALRPHLWPGSDAGRGHEKSHVTCVGGGRAGVPRERARWGGGGQVRGTRLPGNDITSTPPTPTHPHAYTHTLSLSHTHTTAAKAPLLWTLCVAAKSVSTSTATRSEKNQTAAALPSTFKVPRTCAPPHTFPCTLTVLLLNPAACWTYSAHHALALLMKFCRVSAGDPGGASQHDAGMNVR